MLILSLLVILAVYILFMICLGSFRRTIKWIGNIVIFDGIIMIILSFLEVRFLSMFICISARPSNLEELKADAEQAKRDGCEMIEWRVDFFEEIYKADQKAEDISDIVKILNEGLRIWADITERTPMMVCIRRFEEGGAFRFASEFRLRVLKKMLETGLVDMVDIEFEESEEFKRNAMDIIHTYNAQLIYSEHDWTRKWFLYCTAKTFFTKST